MLAVCIITLIRLCWSCEGARILAIAPLTARSHWNVMVPLLKELATRGHQVTVYSQFPQETPLPNYTDIRCSTQIPSQTSNFTYDFIRNNLSGPWKFFFFLMRIQDQFCEVLHDPALQQLMKSKHEYDLLINEVFGMECFTYFAYNFNTPVIFFTTSMALPWEAERVGLPDNPSYIPNYLVNFTPEMNLWERIYNTLVLVYSKLFHQYVHSRQTRLIAEKSFGKPLPLLHEVVANASVLFVNSYHSLSQSRPFPPTVIEVGGIHIKKKQPLPPNLQFVLDNAKNGAIIMSFGSLVRTASLPELIIMMFMNAFSKLEQTVIVKYEEELPNAPSNVILQKWLPQRDMIEHENVVALVVHGGLASTIEAVNFGKPMIGVPLFADQYVNIRAVVCRGGGIQLDLDNISEVKITEALSEILNNPRYKENMNRLSLQFRDRPMTPLQTAVYWTEYVIRHQGAPHLRPASVGMPFYQYLLLDVVAVGLASLSAALCVLYVVVKWAVIGLGTRRSTFHRSAQSSKKTN